MKYEYIIYNRRCDCERLDLQNPQCLLLYKINTKPWFYKKKRIATVYLYVVNISQLTTELVMIN